MRLDDQTFHPEIIPERIYSFVILMEWMTQHLYSELQGNYIFIRFTLIIIVIVLFNII